MSLQIPVKAYSKLDQAYIESGNEANQLRSQNECVPDQIQWHFTCV